MNSLRSILVHVDPAERSAARISIAQQLATSHGARLEALYAIVPRSQRSAPALAEDAMAAVLLTEFDVADRDAARVLVDRANRAGSVQAAWRALDSAGPVEGVVRRACFHDLVVLGQHDPDTDSGVPADFVASVVIDSGRPALVVPSVGSHVHVGRRALIAWKPTRECARAVSAALPMLQRASHVRIAVANERPHATGEELVAYLAAHGVAAELERLHIDGSEAGDGLLSRAADLDADLLVMGCYGHSRLREYVLGGMTRTVLASMTLPVLMAH